MKRILYIHDQQGDYYDRKQALETSGYKVDLASGGSEAIDRIQRNHPDLILLDVLLDGPNGFEVARMLRSSSDAGDIPMIMLSGIYTATHYRQEAMKVGIQGFLAEPIGLPTLTREVTKFAGTKVPREREQGI